MSVKRRRRKAAERIAASPRTLTAAMVELRRRHREERPWCTYGDEPHFIPPCLGDPGFYACDKDRPANPGEGRSDG